MRNKPLYAVLATALLVAGGATAFAAQTSQNDAESVNQAVVTLTQAVTAAEQKAGGRAASADYEHSRALGWVYKVEVVAGAKVFDVMVDAKNGTVLSSALDSADEDEEQDERD